NGVTGYTVNVLASLGGIALYTALCFASQPPAVWFIVAAILAAALFYPLPAGRVAVPAVLLLCGAALSLSTGPGRTWWSPYQKLIVKPNVERGETVGYSLQTNGSWYQKVVNLSPAFVASHPASFRDVPIQLNAYNLPYRFAPSPRSVLILGSGMGNDVAAA